MILLVFELQRHKILFLNWLAIFIELGTQLISQSNQLFFYIFFYKIDCSFLNIFIFFICFRHSLISLSSSFIGVSFFIHSLLFSSANIFFNLIRSSLHVFSNLHLHFSNSPQFLPVIIICD